MTSDRLTYRKVNNSGLSTRFKQALVLLLTVIVGMLISVVSVNAQPLF